jgi:hypothetical protein
VKKQPFAGIVFQLGFDSTVAKVCGEIGNKFLKWKQIKKNTHETQMSKPQ